MVEKLTHRLAAKTFDGLVDLVEVWRSDNPEWPVVEIHYFSTQNLDGKNDGWAATITACRSRAA